MGKTVSVHEILKKEYETYGVNEQWKDTIGDVEKGFRMLVYGLPKQGKSTFVMQMCKYLSSLGKVYYNSTEQGEGKSIQDVLKLCKMGECKAGSFMIGDRDNYEEMMEKCKKNRAQFIVIDSRDYMKLTTEQYKEMDDRFGKKKSVIVICWEENGKPKSIHAKNIRYMVDIVAHVSRGTANIESRFGPTKPYKIFEKKAEPGEQQTLFT